MWWKDSLENTSFRSDKIFLTLKYPMVLLNYAIIFAKYERIQGEINFQIRRHADILLLGFCGAIPDERGSE